MPPILRTTLVAAAALALSSLPRVASACGGFFCNRAQPVNQAAEGIIFADNGDGTTTAVIQIMYQGPSQSFSWLLPIASVPKQGSDIAVASNLAFQRLQAATNPQYTLTTRIEGQCRQDVLLGAGFGGSASASGGSTAIGGSPSGGGVTVEASGVVGAFEWTVISLDKSLANPADAATSWLTANGYDVPTGAGALLGPYLQDGLYLLALRLTKGADSGSIRPIVLTYTGTKPSIPIKLTAVAANDDMGVMTWVLGKTRAVPQNYLSLELNEARINWFNANSTYNAVVTEAANDAGGQGFVTEFAGPTSRLANVVFSASDAATWASFKSQVFASFDDFFQLAYGYYGGWDGFWDATRASVTLPTGVAFEDFKLCPGCYSGQIQFAPSVYLAALDKNVIQPLKSVQDLIDLHPELTRLYSTLSADEMTLDPAFAFNADLPDVSNQHTATRVIECNPSIYQYQASWRVELPQGDIVRGTPAEASSLTWPTGVAGLPPNRRIVRAAETGSGRVIEDNAAVIATSLGTYNASVPTASTGGAISTGGVGMTGGASPTGGAQASNGGTGGGPAVAGAGGATSATPASHDGCSTGGAVGKSSLGGLLATLALAAAAMRRRRRS